METKQWYVVNTYSGHENKVKEKLEMRTKSMHKESYIGRIIVPENIVMVESDGVLKERAIKLFPGYVLVEVNMTDDVWYVIRNTPGVTGFIGSSGKGAKPIPLKDYEIEEILNKMKINIKNEDFNIDIKDKVKIISGPFSGMKGTVYSLNKEENKVEVLVDLFGQETSVECDVNEIERE